MFDSHAFKSNRRNECVGMPRKTARSGSQTPLGRSGMSGAIHPLASGLPASSENAYHPRQFRVHLGNPGLDRIVDCFYSWSFNEPNSAEKIFADCLERLRPEENHTCSGEKNFLQSSKS